VSVCSIRLQSHILSANIFAAKASAELFYLQACVSVIHLLIAWHICFTSRVSLTIDRILRTVNLLMVFYIYSFEFFRAIFAINYFLCAVNFVVIKLSFRNITITINTNFRHIITSFILMVLQIRSGHFCFAIFTCDRELLTIFLVFSNFFSIAFIFAIVLGTLTLNLFIITHTKMFF